jgi:glycosyltransferase involved in cell wall biosynthesis
MILDSHSKVSCPPEPWIVLGIADVLGVEDVTAIEYGRQSALYAGSQFIENIIGLGTQPLLTEFVNSTLTTGFGKFVKHDMVGHLSMSLYGKYLEQHNREMFVDKTPRYYHILNLIDEAFPHAKKVFLQRNPLDVAASYKATWGIPVDELTGEVLSANSYDFCHGLFCLESYFSLPSPNKYVLSYEALVRDPVEVASDLCKFLCIDFQPQMLEFYLKTDFSSSYGAAVVGDPRASKTPGPLDKKSIGRWKANLAPDELVKIMRLLGTKIFRKLGYSDVLDELSSMSIPLPASESAALRKGVIKRLLQQSQNGLGSQDTYLSIFKAFNLVHQERGLLENANRDLFANNEALATDREAKAQVIKRLSADLAAHDVDRNALRTANEALARSNEALATDREAKAQVIQRLLADVAAHDSDRDALRTANEALARNNEALATDREAKAQVIERLLADLAAHDVDRNALRTANEALARSNEALASDREAKAQVIERLLADLAAHDVDRNALRTANDTLARSNEALASDRDAKAQVIERLSADVAARDADRDALRAANETLARNNEALGTDRDAKAQVIERLTADAALRDADRDALRAANETLARNNEALATDRDAKAQVIERLTADAALRAADRDALRAANETLARNNEALATDRDAKAQVIERLTADAALRAADRDALRAANETLARNNEALATDRDAKAQVIERLLADAALRDTDRDALRTANETLARNSEALATDREAKAQVIERLLADVAARDADRDALRTANETLAKSNEAMATRISELTSQSLIREKKLFAKDEVIKTFAMRELERKDIFAGAADVAFHWKQTHIPPSYGSLLPSLQQAGIHVGIDTLEIVFGVSGGVETYMKMLVSALIETNHRVTLICLPDQLAALQSQFFDRVGYFVVRASRMMETSIRVTNKVRRQNKRLIATTSMVTFSRLKEDLGIDVLHSPVQIFSTLDFSVPAVLNLHDLQHLHFPENFRPSDIDARNHLYGLSAALADAVIVSSEFVRKDLINQMSVPASKVFTVPVTWNPMVESGLNEFSGHDARKYYNLPPCYALYPAQFWPHKNHVRLVEALRMVRERSPMADLKLVLTGYRGHSGWPAVAEAIQRCGLANDVICLDYVPVEHLAGLYKAALFCVMPSTFEASSYPVIEAQILGCPAMCSNVTSLPELMRDGAGLLFDPFSTEDIAEKMVQWLNNPADRDAHALRAMQKARTEHSLQNYVAGIGQVYNYVMKESA